VGHLFGLGVVDEALDGTAFEQMLADDLRNVIFRNAAIERAFRVDDHDRTQCAEAEATGLDDLDLLVKTLFLKLFFEMLANRGAPAGRAAGAAAD